MIDLHLTLAASGLLDVALVPLDHGSSLDHWAQGEFFPAINARVAAVMGIAAFMMIVGVAGFLALQYWSKSYVVPTTVLVLMGGSLIGMLPPVLARVAWVLILLAGALGLFGLLWAVIR
jgi:hypothetical protein